MTALAAFWALIPTKDKRYGLAIILLLVGFGVYTWHERSVGASRMLAVQAAAAAKQGTVAAAKTDLGKQNASSAQTRFVATINYPIHDSPHLLVLDSGAATAAVCAAGSAEVSVQPAESSVEHPRDIGPDLDKIGRDSDAQVTYLQDLLRSCVKIGACKLQQ